MASTKRRKADLENATDGCKKDRMAKLASFVLAHKGGGDIYLQPVLTMQGPCCSRSVTYVRDRVGLGSWCRGALKQSWLLRAQSSPGPTAHCLGRRRRQPLDEMLNSPSHSRHPTPGALHSHSHTHYHTHYHTLHLHVHTPAGDPGYVPHCLVQVPASRIRSPRAPLVVSPIRRRFIAVRWLHPSGHGSTWTVVNGDSPPA
ncbi:hypothetical protein F5Y12DRAFT_632412 [Xylaria sp. FL1777]|nr:hypothetical protein F5Y12DRAFT_632412 [Xylaria sp. FL1777]